HNCPGFPGGISGEELLKRLREQLSGYDVLAYPARIRELRKRDGSFVLVDGAGREVLARTVLLATGIVDVLPEVEWIEAAIAAGALRLCPVCDGYEVSDRRIAVYGPGRSTLEHAVFLRTYSRDVVLACSDQAPLEDAEARRAAALGVRVAHAVALDFDGHRCRFRMKDGTTEAFDSVYAFLGADSQSDLARGLGAASDAQGALRVDRDQKTSVEGLYAAGDVVSSLHQISVAAGHGGVAATAIHRALGCNLRDTPPTTRPDATSARAGSR
ncbi:MAG TPA: NAD(P)/FAD-dependent oxidoreductase, partial [Rhodanobacteraceae bacterium]|nr:NAD(P)/FAD-dependent oxidoreductase [Rhodanobacteraceae bacterium]